jgi:hypothetical protein
MSKLLFFKSGSSTLPRKRINNNNLTLTNDEIQMSQASLNHLSLSRYHHGSASNLNNYAANHKTHKRAASVTNENQNTFPPLKNDLLADLA